MNAKDLQRNLQNEIGDVGHVLTDAIGRAIAQALMPSGNTSNRTQPTPTAATPTVATTPKAKTQASKDTANKLALAGAKAKTLSEQAAKAIADNDQEKIKALKAELAKAIADNERDVALAQAREREQIRQGQTVTKPRERVQPAQAEPIVDPLGIVDGVHIAPGIVLTAVDNDAQTCTLRVSFAVGAKIATKQGSYQLYAHTVSQGLQARRGGYCPLGNSGLSLSLKLAKFAN